MERKVEELTRQLAEEKQTSRRALAKLQREVARLKSERTYAQVSCLERERNVLFNNALNTFYLRLYGIRHMVTDHSDSEKGEREKCFI